MSTSVIIKPRILIADRSEIYLSAVRTMVNGWKDVHVVGTCSTTTDLTFMLSTLEVDVLIIDYIIFGEHTVTGIKNIKTQFPNTKMIVLSFENMMMTTEALIEAEVGKFVSKWDDTSKLLDAINFN